MVTIVIAAGSLETVEINSPTGLNVMRLSAEPDRSQMGVVRRNPGLE